MPKLSVEFELTTAQAAQSGKRAADDYSKAFRSELNKNLATAVPKELSNTIMGGGTITPPGLARGPRGTIREAAQSAIHAGTIPEFNNASRAVFQQRLKNVLLGVGTAPFSSWIGARLLSDAAFGGGRGRGGHGGLLGAGGAGGFAEFFIGIEALKKAFDYGAEKIKEVVERGFNLYVKAHQLRQSVGNLFALQEAGQQVGLSQSDIDKFLLRNQWGKARTSLQNFGVFSQLGGLSKDFQDAYKWASEIQGKWQETSRTSYEIQVNFDRIKTDWLTMWNDSNFLKGIDMLTKWTDAALHWSAKQPTGGWFSQLLTATTPIALIGSLFGKKAGTGGTPDTAPLFQLPRQLPQMSQFEKMGFNIGGGRVTDKLDRSNTLLQGILGAVEGMAKFYVNLYNANIPGASGGLINVP